MSKCPPCNAQLISPFPCRPECEEIVKGREEGVLDMLLKTFS